YRTRVVIALEEFGDHFLALANQEQVDKIRDRFGIEENRGTTRDNQGPVAGLTIGSACGDARKAKDREEIQVVGLERDRECQDVEFRQRAAPLEEYEAIAAPTHRFAFIAIGQKRAVRSDE